MSLAGLTVSEAARLLHQRDISAVELTGAVLERISAVEERVKAYVTCTPELALEQAKAADRRLRDDGQAAPLLTGIPAALKDVLVVEGVPTTCGSRMLRDYRPVFDGTAVRLLREAGAVFMGKTNCDEFAMGSSTENSAFFPTRNPWRLDTVPGGSSGGSAAAVAADECLFSLGTDTGGSIRQPAALCGVVGLKPTYGRVSRYGLIAFASSLDQIGPLTKDVADAAMVLQFLCGHDANDSTSADRAVPDFRAALGDGSLKGLRVGVPREYLAAGIEPGVLDRVNAAIAQLGSLGAEVDECSLPSTDYALDTYYIIAPAEASANLARYDGLRYGQTSPATDLWSQYARTRDEGFGPEVKRRIMLGTYVLSSGYYDAYYIKAQKVRTMIKQEFDSAFERFDVLVSPTSPTVAFPLGAKVEDPLAMYLSDVCTIPVNMAGLPGLSLPCGLSGGLPVGLQIIGRPFDEETILRVAYAYERSTEAHHLRAQL